MLRECVFLRVQLRGEEHKALRETPIRVEFEEPTAALGRDIGLVEVLVNAVEGDGLRGKRCGA